MQNTPRKHWVGDGLALGCPFLRVLVAEGDGDPVAVVEAAVLGAVLEGDGEGEADGEAEGDPASDEAAAEA